LDVQRGQLRAQTVVQVPTQTPPLLLARRDQVLARMLQVGREAYGVGGNPGLASQTYPQSVIVRTKLSHATTTYGHGSTGIRRDLNDIASRAKPRKQGPNGTNGGLWDRRSYRYESEGRRFESCRARP
jgi:hypothetical protein